MLKKELRDIMKPVLPVMLILGLFLSLYKLFPGILGREILAISEKLGISMSIDLYLIALVLTIVAGSLGSGAFKSENKDDAFEYLLSSPLPGSKIILYKVLPRLTVLVMFLIVYILVFLSHTTVEINNMLSHSVFINPKFFVFWTLFIFFISLFPSIFRQKNWIAVSSLTTLLMVFVVPVALKKILFLLEFQSANTNDTKIISFLTGMGLILLVSAIAFFYSFKDFDLKECFFEGKRYSLFTLIPQMILLVASIYVFFI